MPLFLKGLKLEVLYKIVKLDLEDFKDTIQIAVQVDNQLYSLYQLKKASYWNRKQTDKKIWRKRQNDPYRPAPIKIDTVIVVYCISIYCRTVSV